MKFSLRTLLILAIISFLGECVPDGSYRIYLVGDSTMADKPLIDNPEHGWGQMLPLFFSENVAIFNHAMNGRSTKSFLSQGRWKNVVDRLQPGDYVFIQFGHNDEKVEDTTRYAAARPDYKENLRRMVRDAREKSAIPVLLTPITRRDFDKDGNFKGTHGDYPDAMKEVADEDRVPLIDMFEKSKELVASLGAAGSKKLYLAGIGMNEFRSWDKKRDDTHFTRAGAVTMASLAVEGIKELRLPLEKELVRPAPGDLPGTGKVVGLDYFFNDEWRMRKDSAPERYHYVWEDTTNSGFSMLGRSIDLLGGDLDTIQSTPTDSVLNRFSIYVLVDPDTPKETKVPNYMSDEAINVIVPWVERGGVLVLMENDSGNAEFEHFNRLANRFGIHFNENSYHKVYGNAYGTGKNDNLPDHPIFRGVKQIFMKEICSLALRKAAEPVLTENGLVWMATARVGNGLVFAVGDPWLYNEYMDTRRLPAEYENAKAGKNLFEWLFKNSKKIH